MEAIFFLTKISFILYIVLVFLEDIILIVPEKSGPATRALQGQTDFLDVGEWLFFVIFNLLFLFIIYLKYNSFLNIILLLPVIGLLHILVSFFSVYLATLVFKVTSAIRGL